MICLFLVQVSSFQYLYNFQNYLSWEWPAVYCSVITQSLLAVPKVVCSTKVMGLIFRGTSRRILRVVLIRSSVYMIERSNDCATTVRWGIVEFDRTIVYFAFCVTAVYLWRLLLSDRFPAMG